MRYMSQLALYIALQETDMIHRTLFLLPRQISPPLSPVRGHLGHLLLIDAAHELTAEYVALLLDDSQPIRLGILLEEGDALLLCLGWGGYTRKTDRIVAV